MGIKYCPVAGVGIEIILDEKIIEENFIDDYDYLEDLLKDSGFIYSTGGNAYSGEIRYYILIHNNPDITDIIDKLNYIKNEVVKLRKFLNDKNIFYGKIDFIEDLYVY